MCMNICVAGHVGLMLVLVKIVRVVSGLVRRTTTGDPCFVPATN